MVGSRTFDFTKWVEKRKKNWHLEYQLLGSKKWGLPRSIAGSKTGMVIFLGFCMLGYSATPLFCLRKIFSCGYHACGCPRLSWWEPWKSGGPVFVFFFLSFFGPHALTFWWQGGEYFALVWYGQLPCNGFRMCNIKLSLW